MRLVSAGWFEMGSTTGDEDEKPVHRVWLDAFYMDTHEVTMKEYQAFRQATGHQALPEWASKYAPGDQHPVIGVSWDDAAAYCRWAEKQLPSEAQWEKAARGTDERMYPWGNEPPHDKLANYDGKRQGTTPVGSFADGKSPYGIHDLAGNVWEWVRDWYDARYYSQSPERNPVNTTAAEFRVLRGGGWLDSAALVRAALRIRYAPDLRLTIIGFRCVVGVSGPRT
jgi:formylglycine-generating enzyme required for sulfatase activity